MSVRCEQFIGYTLTIKENLTSADFEQLNDFLTKHPEYETNKRTGQVALVVDGMSGHYARLVYVEKHINFDNDVETDETYCKLSNEKPDYDVYSAITQVYEELFGTPFGFVNANRIEHAMWLHYS